MGLKMDTNERDIKSRELWNRLTPEIKTKLLSYYQIKGDFSHYIYEDLPLEAKTIIWLKIEHNQPRWLQ